MSSCQPQRSRKRARKLTEEKSSDNSSKGNNFNLKEKPIKKLSVSKKMGVKKVANIDSFKYLKDNYKCTDFDCQIKLLKLELMPAVASTSKSEHKISISGEHKRKDESDTSDLDSTERGSFFEEKAEELNINSSVPCERAELGILQTNDMEISLESELSREATKHLNYHTPTKFSEWLDTTIDLIDSEIKDLGANKNKDMCTSKTENLLCKIPATSSNYLNSDSQSYKLLHEPERLLYESFLLQNLDKYLSSSDENTLDEIKPLNNRLRKQKLRGRRKLNQKTSFKKQRNIFSQRRGKKSRIAQNLFDSSVEVVDVTRKYFMSGSGQNPSNDISDLDLENIDWDEPFDLKKKDDFHLSDLEIIESDSEVICISPPREIEAGRKEKQINEIGKNNKAGRKKSWECPICLEPSIGQEIVTTLCGHVYCKQCLETYHSTTSKSCPSCRTDLAGQSLVTLFNF